MTDAERHHLRVGDKVRDKQTREEGRVTGLVPLVGDLLLVTVALFVGNAIRRKVQFPMRAGQGTGLPVEKIEERVFQTSTRLASDVVGGRITHPRTGGVVSSQVVQKATRNEVVARQESLSVRALKWAEHNQTFLENSPILRGPSRALGAMRSRDIVAEHERQAARRAVVQSQPLEAPITRRQFQAVEQRLEALKRRHLRIRDKIWQRYGESLEAAYSDWLGSPGPREIPRNLPTPQTFDVEAARYVTPGVSPLLAGREERALIRGGAADITNLGQQADREFRRLQRLTKLQERSARRKKGFDTALDYLTRRSEQTPEGKWVGGYLNDIIFNKGATSTSPSLVERHNRIANLLSEARFEFTPIERREFERLYGAALEGYEGNVTSALDVFRIAVNRVSNLQEQVWNGYTSRETWADAAALWNERFAPLLRHLIERYHPQYARDVSRIKLTGRFGRVFEASRERLDLITSAVGFESYNAQALQNIDFQNPARFESELEALIARPHDWLYGHGQDPVGLDLTELRNIGRRRTGPVLPGRGWADRDFGIFNRMFSRGERVGSRFVGRTTRPFAGRVVEYGGVPHILDYINPPGRFENQGVFLRPLGETGELVVANQPFDPQAVLNLIQGLGNETPAARLAREASIAARRATVPKTSIAIRGGLLGAGEAIQEVPTELLYHFLTGTRISKVQWNQFSGELQKLGFTSIGQFEAAQRLAQQRAGGIYGQIPRGELQALLAGSAVPSRERVAQGLEDLTAQFREVLFTNLGDLPHGLHIDEVRAQARQMGWSRVLEAARRGESAIVSPEDILRWGERPIGTQGWARLAKVGVSPQDVRFLNPSTPGQLLDILDRPTFLVDPFLNRVAEAQSRLATSEALLDVMARTPAETLAEYNARVAAEEGILYEESITGVFGNLFGTTPVPRGGGVIGARGRAGTPTIREAIDIIREYDPRRQTPVELAEQLGIELATLDPNEAERLQYLRTLSRIGTDVKAQSAAAREARALEQQIIQNYQRGRIAGVLNEGVGVKHLLRLDPNNLAGPQFYNTLIELLESGRITEEELGTLNLPFQTVPLPGGRFGIAGTLQNDPTARYIYRPFLGGRENAGFAYLESDPSRVFRFGIQGEQLFGEGLREAITRRNLLLAPQAQADRFLSQALSPAIQEAGLGLPIYNMPGAGPIGFASNVTNIENVASSTRRLIEGGQNFISLDIERDIATRRILNISAARYDIQGNLLAPGVDIALPELWEQHEFATPNIGRLNRARQARINRLRARLDAGEELTPQLRTIVKNGQRVQIDRVVASEQQMIREAVAFLQSNPEAIVGHNISFDLGALIESAEANGLTGEAEILRGIASSRLVDTYLASQIALPDVGRLNLEDITRGFLGRVVDDRGRLFREAHIAGPDAALAAEVMGKLAREHSAQILQGLEGIQQTNITPGSLLWDPTPGGGRAYQLVGAIDPNRAVDIAREQLGTDLNIGGGIAVRPINFLTGKPGETELKFWQTPHGFAREFSTRYQVVGNETELAGLMESKAADLARRRVRRIVGTDADAFRNLLLERERFRLAQASAAGDDTFRAALDDLVRRQAATASDVEARLLGNTYRYAQEHLQDSRITKQLLLQEEFWGREMAQHEPIVSRLWEYVQGESRAAQDRAFQQASSVWSGYMRDVVQQAGNWERLPTAEIAPEQRALAFEVGVLGKNARRIRLADEATIGRDVDNLTLSILRKLPESEFKETLAGENEAAVRALLRNRGRVLDTSLGDLARSRVWERYIQPALAKGSTVTLEGMNYGAFNLEATAFPQAVQELLTRGQQFAQEAARNAPNELVARALDPDVLRGIQESYLNRPIYETAAELDRPGILGDVILRSRHRVPQSLQGRSLTDLLQLASTQGEEELPGVFVSRQRAILESLKRAARRFSGEEIAAAQAAIGTVNPDWLGQIFPWTRLPNRPPVVAAQDFTPGAVTPALLNVAERAEQAAESAATWAELNPGTFGRLKAGAAIGALVGAGIAGLSLLRRPSTPPPSTHANPERESNINTTEQSHRVNVRIEAVDPNGIDHAGLTQSVHDAIGNFMGSDITHRPTVTDSRSRIDKSAVDNLASRLLSR